MITELTSLDISDIIDVKSLIIDLTSTVITNKTSEQTDISDVKTLINTLTSTVATNKTSEQTNITDVKLLITNLKSEVVTNKATEIQDVYNIIQITEYLQQEVDSNYDAAVYGHNNQQGQINGNLASYKIDKTAMKSDISDLQDGQSGLAASVAIDFAAVGVTTGVLQTEINATNLTFALLDVDVVLISDNVTKLQTKTQNISLAETNQYSTSVMNEFKISNVSNDKVVLNDLSTGFHYFNTKTIFSDDINLKNTNKLSTLDNTNLNLGSINQAAINLTCISDNGIITLTGHTINLNSLYVTVNNEDFYNKIAGGFQTGNTTINNNYYSQNL